MEAVLSSSHNFCPLASRSCLSTRIVSKGDRPMCLINTSSIIKRRPSFTLFHHFAPTTSKCRGGSLDEETSTKASQYGREGIPKSDDVFSTGALDVASQHSYHKQSCSEKLKPSKTNDRQRLIVEHDYHDHAHDMEEQDSSDSSSLGNNSGCTHLTEAKANTNQKRRGCGGLTASFPKILHKMLDEVEQDGLSWVVSWQPHGRAFAVHDAKAFINRIMPKYFKQTKLTSFQRQLNLYGFLRLTKGPDAGAYYHELFLRRKHFLACRLRRTKVKGTGFKASSNPETEPNFYNMVPITVSPPAPARSATVVDSPDDPPEGQVPCSSETNDVDANLVSRSTTRVPLQSMAPMHSMQENSDSEREQADYGTFEGKIFHCVEHVDPLSLFLDKIDDNTMLKKTELENVFPFGENSVCGATWDLPDDVNVVSDFDLCKLLDELCEEHM